MNEPRAWLEQWLYDTGAAMPGAVRQTAARLLADMEKAGLRIVSADALDTTERQRDELQEQLDAVWDSRVRERAAERELWGAANRAARVGVDTEEKPE